MQDEPCAQTIRSLSSDESGTLSSKSEVTDYVSSVTRESMVGSESDGSQIPSEYGGLRKVPFLLPRIKYTGACNVETVKDGKSQREGLLSRLHSFIPVNFLGSGSQFVVSGSDDGNFFVWDKNSSRVLNVFEADQNVVNVIEENPRFKVLAASGIDHSIKVNACILLF